MKTISKVKFTTKVKKYLGINVKEDESTLFNKFFKISSYNRSKYGNKGLGYGDNFFLYRGVSVFGIILYWKQEHSHVGGDGIGTYAFGFDSVQSAYNYICKCMPENQNMYLTIENHKIVKEVVDTTINLLGFKLNIG